MRGLVSAARLPTETAQEFYRDHFLKEAALSIFLLVASRACSMPRQECFVPYLLPSHVKYYLNSQNFPPI